MRTITVGTLKNNAPQALDEPKDKPSQQGPRDTPMPPEYDQECFENNFASKGRVDNKNGCDQCAHGGCSDRSLCRM